MPTRSRWLICGLAGLLLLPLLAAAAFSRLATLEAQEASPPRGRETAFALTGGTVYPVSSAPIPDGVVVVREGRIAAVGPRATTPIPADCVEISVGGRAVIPGLVELSSSFLLDRGSIEVLNSSASSLIGDALDPASALLAAARAEGITTVGLMAPANRPIGGLGAVVKLSSRLQVLKSDAFLNLALGVVAASFGEPRSATADRLNQYYQLRGQFLAARDYQKAWDNYWEAVAKYNQEASKWKESQTPAVKPEGDKPPPAPGSPDPGSKKAPFLPLERDDPKPDAKKEEPKKEEKKDEKKEEKKAEKPEAPKPPGRPRFDLQREVLLRALTGKLPILLNAHRSDDISYALRLKEEFGLALTITGATEGRLRAAALAAAKVPVVVGPVLLNRWALELMNHSEANAALLSSGGASVALADLDAPGLAARYLRLQAAVAARGGLPADLALRGITLEPALRLGVADRVGSLEPGKDADLIILSGEPLDAAARVERVFIGGETVHRVGKEF